MRFTELNTAVSEIEELRRESQAFREVRQNIGDEVGPQRVFEKVSCRDCLVITSG